jgi:oligoribonuclease NrnB/cAMP/cGMP phosphodiesterase (DHH superfamily)
MLICYHNDLDGHGAGAVAYKFFKKTESNIKLSEVSYEKPFPLDMVEPGEKVVIVDFSIQTRIQRDLLSQKTSNIIWIDHHKTSIEHPEERGFPNAPGIRSVNNAACMLTWQFFYPWEEAPMVIRHISDMDTWTWKLDGTEEITEGLKMFDSSPDKPVWDWLLVNMETNKFLNNIREQGASALMWRNSYYRQLAENRFDFTWEGKRCTACNCAFTSSKVFDSVPNKLDYDQEPPGR